MDKTIPVLDNAVGIINSSVGRDKICRLFQYFLRAILPLIAARGEGHKDLHSRLKAFQVSMGMTRKVLRFGREIPTLKTIVGRLREH